MLKFSTISSKAYICGRQIARNQSGIALIEFALAFPLLLTVGLGGLETANLAMANMQVNQTALLVADNASRVRLSIDEGDVNEIFSGADLSTKGLDFQANGRIILSSLEHNGQTGTSEGQYIRWQRCWGNGSFTSSYGVEGTGKTDNTLAAGMGPAGQEIQSASGTAVMFVEVAYTYQPLVSNALFGTRILRATSAFNVRERTDQAIKNGGNLTTAQKALCA